MKIVFLNPKHPKNIDALKRMCASQIPIVELELTHSLKRCKENADYDILISNEYYFNPDIFPSSIKKIIFGPQCFILPKGDIIGTLNTNWAKKCCYNVLCDWNEQAHLEYVGGKENLKIPLVKIPFAIDTEKFKPLSSYLTDKEFDCIIYFKQRDPKILKFVLKILRLKKLSYCIVIYGNYKENEYVELLHKSKFMLVIDRHESQGFALQEAMSCNIPLLVLDVKNVYEIFEFKNFLGKNYFDQYKPLKLCATSVPYWSHECGLKTYNVFELFKLIDEILEKLHLFQPRKFILDNLSEEVCMKRLLLS